MKGKASDAVRGSVGVCTYYLAVYNVAVYNIRCSKGVYTVYVLFTYCIIYCAVRGSVAVLII